MRAVRPITYRPWFGSALVASAGAARRPPRRARPRAPRPAGRRRPRGARTSRPGHASGGVRLVVRPRARTADPSGVVSRFTRTILRTERRAGAGAGTRCAHGRRLPCLPRACGADDVQRAAPRCVQLLHASTARDVRRRGDPRAVAPTGRGRLARGPRRRLRRGGGDALARGSGRDAGGGLGGAHERRRHGQPDGARRRARGPPAAAPLARTSAARRRPRGSARLRQRSNPFLGRARARRAGVPSRRVARRRLGRPVPAATRARRRGDRV